MPKSAQFRFYEELNDFLPEDKKKSWFLYNFMGNPTVKDTVEAIGVPHTEIDLILANSKSVEFSYHLQDGDMISVYPVFESLDISNLTHLREKPLRIPKYVLDVHLGKLAKYLRMLGFDTLYDTKYTDKKIIKTAEAQKRTILTRDLDLLKNKTVTHGYWIRSQDPVEQTIEVVLRFDLFAAIKPLSRCIACNGTIKKTPKDSIMNKLQPKTKLYFNEFYQCTSCENVYWKGSHYSKMQKFIEEISNRISREMTDANK